MEKLIVVIYVFILVDIVFDFSVFVLEIYLGFYKLCRLFVQTST